MTNKDYYYYSTKVSQVRESGPLWTATSYLRTFREKLSPEKNFNKKIQGIKWKNTDNIFIEKNN